MTFFTEPEQKILMCTEIQKTLNSQNNLEEEKQRWRIKLPDFRLYYKATDIKTV